MPMLLEKLIVKQIELGMDDGRFANELGISRSLWQGTRTERWRISEKVIRGTQRRFPDLSPEILIFLSSDASKPTGIAS